MRRLFLPTCVLLVVVVAFGLVTVRLTGPDEAERTARLTECIQQEYERHPIEPREQALPHFRACWDRLD
jgi:hypothetical protein